MTQSPVSSSDRHKLLERAGLYQQAERLYDRLEARTTVCPSCERPVTHPDVIKYGRTQDGIQRHKCQPCERHFTEDAQLPDHQSHHGQLTWKRFVTMTLTGWTLRAISNTLGVALSTAHEWRLKVLRVLQRHNERQTFDQMVVWGDEVFVPAGSPGRSFGGSDMRCILTLYDGECARMRFVSTGMASMRLNDARPTLRALESHNVLITDGDDRSTYASYCADRPVTHEHRLSGHPLLKPINRLHKRLKDFIAQFNGISQRYLNEYLAWFAYVDKHPESTRANL